MGLSISHCEFNFSYSGFHRYRIYLANLVGIDLERMEGFGGGNVSWDDYKDEGLVVFLSHSDCDGYICVKDLVGMRERLSDLLLGMEKYEMDVPHRYLEMTKELISGCDAAIENNESLEFY